MFLFWWEGFKHRPDMTRDKCVQLPSVQLPSVHCVNWRLELCSVYTMRKSPRPQPMPDSYKGLKNERLQLFPYCWAYEAPTDGSKPTVTQMVLLDSKQKDRCGVWVRNVFPSLMHWILRSGLVALFGRLAETLRGTSVPGGSISLGVGCGCLWPCSTSSWLSQRPSGGGRCDLSAACYHCLLPFLFCHYGLTPWDYRSLNKYFFFWVAMDTIFYQNNTMDLMWMWKSDLGEDDKGGWWGQFIMLPVYENVN